MEKRRILIVDNNDELRAILEDVLGSLGHEAVVTGDREEALNREDLDQFDLIISDLTEDAPAEQSAGTALREQPTRPIGELHRKHLLTPVGFSSSEPIIVKAFKMGAGNYVRGPYDKQELRDIVEQTLSYKLRYVDDPRLLSHTHEKIEFELPSDLTLMNGVLQYLLERVAKLGLISREGSNLFVALDEAFVNAVKHGNKDDPKKLVRVGAELTPTEASFTIEDEGEGFDVQTIPDPRDPANLFKSSGRGVLLIYNIMDEVEYNAQGNRVKMVKRPAPSVETQLVESDTPSDKQARNG
ncbi:MAG TPA: ATP-binding protein [Pyrinomonadaceae bacterium]|nr:ATP-binding protein [Pyrinomonadaceae bacterium]